MEDTFTTWDYVSDTDYTSWDDVIGGPSEALWDLTPALIDPIVRFVLTGRARIFKLAGTGRRFKLS